MKTHPSLCEFQAQRGSTLVAVMIIALALVITAGSLFSTLLFDKKMNRRVALVNDARNAAEGVAEIAAAELDRRARSYSTLPASPLNGYSLPTAATSALSSSHVGATTLEYKAGALSPLPDMPVTIDPTDPFNANDSDIGKPVSVRHSYIYSKATAVDPATGQSVTSYISTLVQIRSQSWLNFGVFGNLDLEFHSGSTMEVFGPVHSNYNIYVTAGGGEQLLFYEQCTALRRILRKYKYNSTVTHTGAVKFAPRLNPTSSQLVAMGLNPVEDSRKSGFKAFAQGKWKGFVQDQTFNVLPFNPPGLLEYQEDDYATTGTNETLNSAYAMIEPQLTIVADVNSSSADNPTSHEYAGHKGEVVETLKFSAMSGLTIRVKKHLNSTDWNNSRLDNDDPNFDPGFELVYYTGSSSSARPVNRDNVPERGSNGKPTERIIPILSTRMSAVQRNRLFAAVKLVEFRETGSGSNGNKRLRGTSFADESSGTNSSTGTANDKEWFGIYDRRQGYQYSSSSGSNNNNGYKGAYHVLHIDMGKLNAFLNATAAEWTDLTDSTKQLYTPNASYSGVIYVQFPMEPYSTASVFARRNTDKIRPAKLTSATEIGYALMVRNAARLPQFASNTSVRDDGLSLVTNGPLYILGHYNADGSSSTGSAMSPDSGHDEIPALIAADSVTLLSSAYDADGDFDANEDDSDADARYSALTPLNNAAFTEVSAAIIAGVIPTRLNTSGNGRNDQWMGGVHNYVRFLENWSGDSFRYRGSMALLFENEVALAPWYQSYYAYWYAFPERDVGYHTYFANGISTPGMPFMRTVRRINVDDITVAEWTAGPPTPPKAAVR